MRLATDFGNQRYTVLLLERKASTDIEAYRQSIQAGLKAACSIRSM